MGIYRNARHAEITRREIKTYNQFSRIPRSIPSCIFARDSSI